MFVLVSLNINSTIIRKSCIEFEIKKYFIDDVFYISKKWLADKLKSKDGKILVTLSGFLYNSFKKPE